MKGNLREESVARIAIESLFDFTAASPSVFHRWVFSVLEAIRAPCEVTAFVAAFYSNAEAYWIRGERFIIGIDTGTPVGIPKEFQRPLLWEFLKGNNSPMGQRPV